MAAKRNARTGFDREAVMSEESQVAGGRSARPVMDVHDMLAASARLGAYRPRGRSAGPRFAQPQRYDESGFPIPESRDGLTRRVRQLLRG
jgi:hypothetical protein